ncbi:Primase D5 [Dissostichus eleginoides]|uniref:Primase D5 n=1 Tax=Dissostichus eleginoides TaxID=100907 RepID=A0AAD9CGR3_DISEL|nr:Primase D5 [Dissostichus eleginoides]
MSWWMNHQIQVHSERVQLAIIKASSATPTQSNPIQSQRRSQRSWLQREGTFDHRPNNSRGPQYSSEDVNCIHGNVFTSYELSDSEFEDLEVESSLEVEQVAAEITELMDQQKSIGNAIRTCLSKEYVKASSHCMVKEPLVAACEETPAKRTPKRRGAIGRFFSSVGRAIANVCRYRGPRPM